MGLNRLSANFNSKHSKCSIDPLSTLNEIINKNSNSSTKFKNLHDLILKHNLNSDQKKSLYNLLEKKFREIEFDDTPQSWVQRADLLDAIDLLVAKDSSLPNLSVEVSSSEPSSFKEGTVPLIPYDKMKKAAEKLKHLSKTLVTLDEVQKELEKNIVGEYTNTANTIRKLTRQNLLGESILSVFYRILTRFLGVFYNHPAFVGKTLDQISTFSQKMGIQSIETLSRKIKSPEGMSIKQFYYRGPRFLFGQSVHDFQTVNQWFKRDLTEKAREEYLTKLRAQESKLDDLYGPATNEESRVVVSNADSRVRLHTLAPNQFGQLQELTGKVLNDEAEKQAQLQKDHPTYYSDKYKFNTKNLLGRKSNDLMLPKKLSSKQKKVLNNQMEELKKVATNKKDTTQLERAIKSTKKKIMRQANTQTLITQAQHELLAGIYRVFNSEGAVQVIQRLAPADIHNYVAPLNGTPLSHRAAVVFLKERLQEKQQYLHRQDLNEKEQKSIEAEIEVYAELEAIFSQQEELLGRPSQATIDIYGTNLSVSTPAIQNQSSILAQNDRKVMLFKHEDGSFSLHVFIGATGVNRVDVDPSTLPKKQGARQGDMQFGPDTYKAQGDFQAAGDKTTKDGLKKLRVGEREGSFPINGSTVISYYLPLDFTLLPKPKEVAKHATYGEGIEKATIEIQAKIGNPLLIKTEVALVKALEKSFPDLFKLEDMDIKDQLKNLSISASDPDAEHLSLLKKLWNSESLSFSEIKLKERVQTLIKKRRERIKNVMQN